MTQAVTDGGFRTYPVLYVGGNADGKRRNALSLADKIVENDHHYRIRRAGKTPVAVDGVYFYDWDQTRDQPKPRPDVAPAPAHGTTDKMAATPLTAQQPRWSSW